MINKPLVLLLLLLGVSSPFAGERLSNGFTQDPEAFFRAGFWWDPGDPGWGLDLHMSGESLVGIWATYDGEGNATWYLGVGSKTDDAWVMPLTRYRWDGAAAQPDSQTGELRLEFTDGHHANLSWTLGASLGSAAIEPFIVDPTPVVADRTGFWFETAQPGYGLSVSTQGPLLMSVLYFYDGAGEPRWAWADNGGIAGAEMPLLSFTRCDCPGGLASTFAGELGLDMPSETRGILDAELTLADPLAGNWSTSSRIISMLTNPPSGRKNAAQLVPFSNPNLVDSYLRQASPAYPYYPAIDFSPQPPGTGPGAVSGTNLQEQGVDEADLIKSDGEFVYALSGGGSAVDRDRLRVFQIDPSSPVLISRADLRVGSGADSPQGMYLATDRPNGQPDLLVVFSGMSSYYDPFLWYAPDPWSEGRTKLFVFDVSDPANPTLSHEIEIQGGGAQTRRIGEVLYLVTRFIPDSTSAEGTLLPGLKINGEDRGPLTDPGRIYLAAQSPQYPFRDLLSLTAFDLGNFDADPQSVAMVGFPDAMYVSLNNVFVATSSVAYRLDTGFGNIYYPVEVFTDVHQFSLAESGVEYAGSGSAPGFLPYAGVGPAFSFSEYAGHLRVVTTSPYMFGDHDHRLSVLRLAGEDRAELPVVGFIPNLRRPAPIGKPGEFLYGLRFLGERLYAVTFKKIDPLYVIDLSEPADPHIMGELELPGFSDYLHPLPNDLVLGFGKNTAPAEGPGDGDFAWYQGLQLSLFDVSDPTHPDLIRRVDVGRRGSSSSLLRDHHAFSYLPPDPTSGRPARVAIPVVVHDARTPAEISPVPHHFYDWRFTGLAMFEVFGPGDETPGLELSDVLVTHDAETNPGHDYYQDGAPLAGRGLISEENAYFYLRGELYSSPWGDGDGVLGPY